MPDKVTYANVYTAGLSDTELSAAFERQLSLARESEGPECPHRIEDLALSDGERFQRHDPSDVSRIVAFAQHAPRDVVARAVEVARRAAPSWRRTPYEERCQLLERVRDLITGRRVELATLLSLEVGKTRADAFVEVDECIAILELFCDQMRTNDGYNVALKTPSASKYAGVALAPYGVFGVIAPFNFPFAIPVGMIASSLVTGNTVVFKPSAITPFCGEVTYDLFASAGAPAGILSLIQGGAETGTALAESSIDGLVFTGSAQVGLELARQFTSPPYLRPLIAEMGGKNPGIVTGAAADLGVAARAVAHSAYGMSGQKCNACSRAIVTADVYDEFLAELCDYAGSLRVTDPLDTSAFTGPVVNEEARARFQRSVEMARRDGAIRLGGEAGDGAGLFVDLTIVDGLPRDHELTREELFLPFLSVTRVDSFDAALTEANAIRYGLAAGLFSEDENEKSRFLDEIEAGIVFVNNPGGATTGVWPGSQTMAGWKGSGSTGKGGFGPYYLQQFLREQSRTIYP